MRQEPVGVYACDVGLAEVKCPLDLIVASLAERCQVPREKVRFVAVEMMNREHMRRASVLGAAELTAPAGASSDPF